MLKHKCIVRLYPSIISNAYCKRMFHVSYCSFVRRIANTRRQNSHLLPELQEKPRESDARALSCNTNFYGIESDEGVIFASDSSTPIDFQNSSNLHLQNKSVEKFHTTQYGVVRRDGENKLKYHGQYEYSNEHDEQNTERVFIKRAAARSLVNFIEKTSHSDKQLSNNASGSVNYRKDCSVEAPQHVNSQTIFHSRNENSSAFQIVQDEIQFHEGNINTENRGNINYFDEQYFQDILLKNVSENVNYECRNLKSPDEKSSNDYNDISSVSNPMNGTSDIKNSVDFLEKSNSDFIEEQYFQSSVLDTQKNNYLNEEKNTLSCNSAELSYEYDANKLSDVECNKNEACNFDNVYPKRPLSESFTNFNEAQYCEPPNGTNAESHIKNNFAVHFGYSKTVSNNKFNEAQNHSSFEPENTEIHKENISPVEVGSAKSMSGRKYHDKIPLKSEKITEIYYQNLLPKEEYTDRGNCNNFKYSSINDGFVGNDESNVSRFTGNSKELIYSNAKKERSLRTSIYKKSNAEKTSKSSLKVPSDETKTATAAEEPEIKTAHDFAMKIRSRKTLSASIVQGGKIVLPSEVKQDSKGFRILKDQVPSFHNCTNDEVLEVLLNSVLYSDDDLIVLNKPYNLVIHDSETTKKSRDKCLAPVLDSMAKELDKKSSSPKLFTIHRIDKETTGCLLLARNEMMAQTLKSYFAQRKILKTYWIITTKVPEPLEGIIDIPVAEGLIEKKSRMVLQPEIPEDMNFKNHCQGGKRAVTRYKVLSTSGNAALIEVKPETGIKHQIRVHFGFGLACPILGDHKYSHLTKLAPQKLPADLLQRLQVRQSKVRYIPMHIHAQNIVIPQYCKGRNLYVSAPLPNHMRQNLKALKFKK